MFSIIHRFAAASYLSYNTIAVTRRFLLTNKHSMTAILQDQPVDDDNTVLNHFTKRDLSPTAR